MQDEVKDDREEVRQRGRDYCGREPKIYLEIRVADREAANKEEAETGILPIRGGFSQYLDPNMTAANPALVQAFVALLQTARAATYNMGRIVEEATKGRIKSAQFVKTVYGESMKLLEGHPDAKFGMDLGKPKPRRREPEEPEDKKGGIVP